MGAEHSQQRAEADGRELFDGDLKLGGGRRSGATPNTSGNSSKRRSNVRQNTSGSGFGGQHKQTVKSGVGTSSPNASTSADVSRPSSPPLSVCSDLPYVSYTDKPIGDSPKIRSRPHNALQGNIGRSGLRRSHPGAGAKPKRPQSNNSGSIVIVKPGTREADYDIDPELARLQSIPQFLPVLRETVVTATLTRDQEVLERLNSQHLLNICSRMQSHYNVCASLVAGEQSHLVERTKIVSNSITTLFASFVDMQKTYAAYAEQFAKIRAISQQLSRCNSILHENIASIEAINNFLDVDDRLEPFVWRTDDSKLRGEAEGAVGGGSGRLTRM